MKVVVLSYYFPPLKAPRATQVERLVKYSKLPILVLCAAEGAKPSREGVDVSVFPDRTPRWLSILRQIFLLPDRFRPWANQVAKSVLSDKLINKDDILVTFGQPMSDHLAGLYLKRRIGMRWVAHFSDPWSDNPYLTMFTRFLLRNMEQKVCSEADCLLFTSPDTLSLVMKKYPSSWRSKAAYLPHAYDAGLYGDNSPQHKQDGSLVLRYLGNFYGKRSPLIFAKALLLLLQERPDVLENVKIELVGRWIGHAAWKPEQIELPESILSFREPVDYKESLRLMRKSDALLIIDAPLEKNLFFPSKLADYLGAGRPLIAITPQGTSADIVKKAQGIVISPHSIRSIADGFSETLTQLRRGLCRKPDHKFVTHYDALNVAPQFDALIQAHTNSVAGNQND